MSLDVGLAAMIALDLRRMLVTATSSLEGFFDVPAAGLVLERVAVAACMSLVARRAALGLARDPWAFALCFSCTVIVRAFGCGAEGAQRRGAAACLSPCVRKEGWSCF